MKSDRILVNILTNGTIPLYGRGPTLRPISMPVSDYELLKKNGIEMKVVEETRTPFKVAKKKDKSKVSYIKLVIEPEVITVRTQPPKAKVFAVYGDKTEKEITSLPNVSISSPDITKVGIKNIKAVYQLSEDEQFTAEVKLTVEGTVEEKIEEKFKQIPEENRPLLNDLNLSPDAYYTYSFLNKKIARDILIARDLPVPEGKASAVKMAVVNSNPKISKEFEKEIKKLEEAANTNK